MRWAALLLLIPIGCGSAADRTVEIDIRHSRFLPQVIEVQAGEHVTFAITNHDPIDHEFILGGPEVHDRHRDGTEPFHGAVPGEVSVPAVADGATTYRFDEPGELEFACHLPGHLAYGMRGVVRVR